MLNLSEKTKLHNNSINQLYKQAQLINPKLSKTYHSQQQFYLDLKKQYRQHNLTFKINTNNTTQNKFPWLLSKLNTNNNNTVKLEVKTSQLLNLTTIKQATKLLQTN